jgi:formate hydrogenlyase regulatory protein HycA
MAVPEIIPIVYEPDYHTGTIGHWEGGQFFGSVIAAFREGYTRTDD